MNLIHEMLEAIKAGNITTVKKLLQSNSALVNARDDTGDSALLLSLYNGKKEITELLLAHGPEINFFEAAALGNIARLWELLKQYPELATSYSHDGFTALHLAAFFNHADAVELLLANHTEVNAAAKNQSIAPHATPLHSAVARGNAHIVAMLLNAGAHVNAQQQGGFTPLHGAVFGNNEELVKLLIRHHADTHIRTEEGKTARSIAKEKGFNSLIELLQHH